MKFTKIYDARRNWDGVPIPQTLQGEFIGIEIRR